MAVQDLLVDLPANEPVNEPANEPANEPPMNLVARLIATSCAMSKERALIDLEGSEFVSPIDTVMLGVDGAAVQSPIVDEAPIGNEVSLY